MPSKKAFSIMRTRRGKDSVLFPLLISYEIGYYGAAGATNIMREELPSMSEILGSSA